MEWIRVKDELPEQYTDVVVIARNGDASWYLVAFLNAYGKWEQNGARRINGEVTHWAELPEPPKEED